MLECLLWVEFTRSEAKRADVRLGICEVLFVNVGSTPRTGHRT